MKPDAALVSMAVLMPQKYEGEFAKLCREWYNEDDAYYDHAKVLEKAAGVVRNHARFTRSQTRLCRLLRQYEGSLTEDRMIQKEALNV